MHINIGGRLVSICTIWVLLIWCKGAVCSDWELPVGVAFEHNFYSQYGFSASLANHLILGGHPQITVSVTTSRLGVVAGYNILKKENWLLTTAWHFRPGKYVDPFAGVDVGWTHFDRENEALFKRLKNTALLFNIRTGIAATILSGRLIPVVDGGITIVHSSTVFPLFFGAKLCYDVMKRGF